MSTRLRGGFVILAALAILVLLAKVSAQDDEGIQQRIDAATFRPAEDILQGELIVTNFAADGTATLPIETSLPVACSIVYGKTAEFGALAVDQDMAGGSHSAHNPLLSGLESNTLYYFRVQGVDANGIIYLSDILTFTTPDFAALQREIQNLASPALGAEVTAYSSAFGNASLDARWGAASAFDDNPNTEWATAGDGDSAWIEVQLAHKARIHSVEFWSRVMGDGSAATLAFTVTADGHTTYGPFTLPDASQPYLFAVQIEAQTLRFNLVETTGGNTGIVNVAVYGEFIED